MSTQKEGRFRLLVVLLLGILLVSALALAADCSSWPCDCGDNITASITMTSDLHCASGSALDIGIRNITIDCDNNDINVTGAATYAIDNDLGHDNITIKNCNIYADANSAIYLANMANATIINNFVNLSGSFASAIHLNFVNSSLIENNTVESSGSGSNNIRVTGENYIIRNNTVNTTAGVGIHLDGSPHAYVSYNTVITNGSSLHGISIIGTTENATLLNNNLTIRDDTSKAISDTSGNTRINYLVYNSSFGEVRWINTTDDGFLKDMEANNSLGFGHNIFIANNTIAINVSGIGLDPALNSTVNITIKNQSFLLVDQILTFDKFTSNSTLILENGTDCSSGTCTQLSYSGGELIFETSSLQSFIANGSTTYECGDNITSSTNITHNISGCSANGLIFTTPNILFDCNGHSIIGTQNAAGIYINVSNVTIENCGISNFSSGIFLNGSSSLANAAATRSVNLTNNTISDNTQGIKHIQAVNSTIESNRLINNGDIGINISLGSVLTRSSGTILYNNISGSNVSIEFDASDTGGTLFTYHDFVIVQNNFFNNTHGIRYQDPVVLNATANWWGTTSCTDIASNLSVGEPVYHEPYLDSPYPTGTNTSCSTPYCGMILFNSSNITSSLTACNSTAIVMYTAHNDELNCNGYTLSGSNSDHGVYSVGSKNFTIRNCRITNFTNGVYEILGSSVNVTNNTLSNSTESGIRISTSSTSIINNTITATNWSSVLQAAAISIGTSTLISGNNVTNNGGTALYVSGGGTFRNNIVRHNNFGYHLRSNGNILEKELLENNSRGVLVNNSINSKFSLSTFVNNTNDVFSVATTTSNITFINTSLNKSSLSTDSGSTIFSKSYIIVSVNDSSGVLSDATLEAYDSLSNLENSSITDSDGKALLEVTEFYRTGASNFFLTPSSIVAYKGNYTKNTSSVSLVNVTQSELNFTLKEVTCNSTLTNDFVLGNNFSCSGEGLIATVNGITIDGAGNFLKGSQTGTGINLSSVSDITIINLTVTNFSKGIYLYSSNNSQLIEFNIQNNSYGVFANTSYNSSIRDSFIQNNSIADAYITNEGGTNTSFINSSIDIHNVTINGTANVLLKWYVDVNVSYNDGELLQGATVNGSFEDTNETDDSQLTDGNGLARLTLTELKKNSSGIFNLTPHNISTFFDFSGTISSNSTTVNLSQTNSTDVNFSLTLDCTAPTFGDNSIGTDTSLCPGSFTVGTIEITANDVELTCVNTNLSRHGSADVGIKVNSKENVLISGCSFSGLGFDTNIEVFYGNNVTIENTVMKTNPSRGFGINCLDSGNITVRHSDIEDITTLRLYGCDSAMILNNTFTTNARTSLGLGAYEAINYTIINNTFLSLPNAIIMTSLGNNSFYYNNFSESSQYHIDYSSIGDVSGDVFNTSINTSGNITHQGNIYSDYCDKGSDDNSDGYADSVSLSGGDWPFSANISAKITDNTTDNASVIDYGPYMLTCPAENIFLGSSSSSGGSGGGSSTSGGGGESATAAPAAIGSPKKKEMVTDVYSAEDARKFLQIRDTISVQEGEKTSVTFTFENTGEKAIRLIPEALVDTDHQFIITKKTLGFKGSFLEDLSSLSYSRDAVLGRLLGATLESETIEIPPGETINTNIKLDAGLSLSSTISIQFTSFNEVVTVQEVEVAQKAFSGTAIDVEGSLVDIYAIIIPAQIAQSVERTYAGEEFVLDETTGEAHEYMLEVDFNQKQTSFADLYGPYIMRDDQAFIFAQQFELDRTKYTCPLAIKTSIYRDGVVQVQNEHQVC